jgi:hypothetical protein
MHWYFLLVAFIERLYIRVVILDVYSFCLVVCLLALCLYV